jgi:hypothetical protein
MPEQRKKDTLAPADKRVRHGLKSWVNSKRVPYGRTFQKVRAELGLLQEELIEAHGGEEITPDARILVSSVIEGLGVQQLLGLYIRKYGVVDDRAAKRGQLELSPILGKSWISYANVVRQGLLALKEIEKGRQPSGPDCLTIAAEIDRETRKAAEKRSAVPQDATSPEDSPDDTTDNADGHTGGTNDEQA